MIEATHRPEGYRHLGLQARTLPLRWRPGASVARLAQRVERWEHERGNPHFEARHLDRLPASLAYELAHVYVSLREWFPAVRPDFVDFSAHMPRNTLADALAYPTNLPALRAACAQVGIECFDDARYATDDLEEVDTDGQARYELASCEQLASRRPVDLSAAGSIALNRLFATKRGYRDLAREWRDNSARAEARGRPGRVPSLSVSPAALVLIHEFGHLVDDALFDSGKSRAARVYASLSQALYGGRRPQTRQWGRHLINYPCRHPSEAGPYAGGPGRATQIRRARRDEITYQLGTYAATCRDELFADALALSFGAGDAGLRRRLRRMRHTLADVGLARHRRPRGVAR